MGQPLQHEPAPRRVDHGLTGLAQPLVVLAEPPALPQPAEGACGDPSPREDAADLLLGGREAAPLDMSSGRVIPLGDPAPCAARIRGMLDALDRPAQRLFDPVLAAAGLALIRPAVSPPGTLRGWAAPSSTQGTAARSWMWAAGPRPRSTRPRTSPTRWRFRPLSFLAPSSPRIPPTRVVLTAWLSMIPALGWTFRPCRARSWPRRRALSRSPVPSSRKRRK